MIIRSVFSVAILMLTFNHALAQESYENLTRFFSQKPAPVLTFDFTTSAQGWSYQTGNANTEIRHGKLMMRYDVISAPLVKSLDEPQFFNYVEVNFMSATAAILEISWRTSADLAFTDKQKVVRRIHPSERYSVCEFYMDASNPITHLSVKFTGTRGIAMIDSISLSQRRVKTDIGKDIRDSIRMYPHSSFEHTVSIAPSSTLFFACGLRNTYGQKLTEPVRFQVFLKLPDSRRRIWETTYHGQTAWVDAVVDLSSFEGKEASFIFTAESKDIDGQPEALPVFNAPIIYTKNKEKPNIILIGADALRADHLGCYGYSRPTSPSIDRLAKRGVIFQQAFSQCSWTLPSFTSIVTGLYPFSHNVEDERDVLNPSVLTIQHYMRDNGYYSAGFTNGGYLTSWLGWDRGFDMFVQNNHLGGGNFSFSFADYKRQLFDFIRANRSCPMFLFLHTYDCHAYYDSAPPQYQAMFTNADYPDKNNLKAKRFADYHLRQFKDSISAEDVEHIKGLYDSEIRYLDDMLGQLFSLLDELELSDNTIIILTSDHGEEFKDHGSFGHNHTLYNELIHIPLIFAGGSIPAGVTVSHMVESIDIFPTVIDLINTPPLNPPIDGQSLIPLISDPHHAGFGPAVSKDWNKTGIRTEGWTYFTIDGTEYLFNRNDDPIEKNNLIQHKQKEAQSLKRRLERITAKDDNARPQPLTGEMDERSKQELKSLGYIR